MPYYQVPAFFHKATLTHCELSEFEITDLIFSNTDFLSMYAYFSFPVRQWRL